MAARKFAPMPLRAISDKELTLIHFRVLAAIAKHDGMSLLRGKGQGCWASTTTLAQLCDSHITNVSTAIHELVRFGYVTREKHPTRQKTWILRIVYEPQDLPVSKTEDLPSGKESHQSSTEAQQAKVVLPDSRDVLSERGEMICPPGEKPHIHQDTAKQNIFCLKQEDILLKQEKSSSEEASTQSVNAVSNERIATRLRLTEQQLKNGKPRQQKPEAWGRWLHETWDWLTEVTDVYQHDDSLHGWAFRLLQTYDLLQEESA